MEKLFDALIAAALENVIPLLVSLILGAVALGYRRALVRLKKIVAASPNTTDDRLFEAFESELRKRGLLPDGYESEVTDAKRKALESVTTKATVSAASRVTARLSDKIERP